jgi:hypothetical protein
MRAGVGYEGGGRGFRSEVKAGEANCAIAYPPSFVQPDLVALGDLDLDASSPARVAYRSRGEEITVSRRSALTGANNSTFDQLLVGG